MNALEILYRDDDLIAINKPSGLLVHRSLVDKRETRFAIQILRNQIGQWVYPLHRLDKPTSGVLLFALSSEVARLACLQFRERQVKKTYLAVVRGWTDPNGRIDYPLKEEQDAATDALADPETDVKEAVTDYRTRNRIELPTPVGRYATARYSLIQASPLTGRKHQIRRHMAHLRHPIIGDTTHGDGQHNRFFRAHFSKSRLLLHAWKTEIAHPVTQEPLFFKAPLDEAFNRVLQEFGWLLSERNETEKEERDLDHPMIIQK